MVTVPGYTMLHIDCQHCVSAYIVFLDWNQVEHLYIDQNLHWNSSPLCWYKTNLCCQEQNRCLRCDAHSSKIEDKSDKWLPLTVVQPQVFRHSNRIHGRSTLGPGQVIASSREFWALAPCISMIGHQWSTDLQTTTIITKCFECSQEMCAICSSNVTNETVALIASKSREFSLYAKQG